VKTNASPGAGRQGFTLIEVLVAMVILAVGLLGLEALGIRAVRMVAAGKKQSEYAVLASSRIERARYQISANPAALTTGSETVTMTGGAVNVATQVTSPASTTAPYVVTVTVTPSAQVNAPQPFSMTSYVYSQ
jgi:type IV pilus assembly protein PilV